MQCYLITMHEIAYWSTEYARVLFSLSLFLYYLLGSACKCVLTYEISELSRWVADMQSRIGTYKGGDEVISVICNLHKLWGRSVIHMLVPFSKENEEAQVDKVFIASDLSWYAVGVGCYS